MTANHRDLALAPGFRFFPTDEELMRDYLIRKCAGQPVASTVIAEVDLYRFDPWQLPDMASYGEKEWYFFTPRDRKYPHGKRPNRSAGTGYWKATGADRPIGLPNPIGIKKSLVFYTGKAPTGIKTNWIMHEYRLANVDRSAARNRNRLRLDDWVLCRVYNKKGNIEMYPMTQPEASPARGAEGDRSPEVSLSIGLWLNPPPSESHTMETSDSVPILHPESSGSEPTNFSDPEPKADEKEVQSEPKVEGDDFGKELEKAIDFSMVGYLAESDLFGTRPRLQTTKHFSPLRLQDMFVFSQPKTQQADQKKNTQQKPRFPDQ